MNDDIFLLILFALLIAIVLIMVVAICGSIYRGCQISKILALIVMLKCEIEKRLGLIEGIQGSQVRELSDLNKKLSALQGKLDKMQYGANFSETSLDQVSSDLTPASPDINPASTHIILTDYQTVSDSPNSNLSEIHDLSIVNDTSVDKSISSENPIENTHDASSPVDLNSSPLVAKVSDSTLIDADGSSYTLSEPPLDADVIAVDDFIEQIITDGAEKRAEHQSVALHKMESKVAVRFDQKASTGDDLNDEPVSLHKIDLQEQAAGWSLAGDSVKPETSEPSYFDRLSTFIRAGNIWVMGGVIMLLLGFAFCVQLGFDYFSLEVRLAFAGLAGMGMLAGGFLLREKRRVYAITLQGGGIGVLYLTIFATAKLTTLMPTWAALVLLTLLIFPSVALAVLQRAQVLALVGFFGGFAAPILLSTQSGNYVALFSYYTLLNLGILSIAFFKSWRELNFVGAFCTFVVMGYWGYTKYSADMFWTVLPFLAIFTLIYLAISFFYIRRKLVVGSVPADFILAAALPFISALLQWSFAQEVPHGLSLSAVCYGAFFIIVASLIWKYWGNSLRWFAEFYLVNGVLFANLSIPLELSGAITSTVWVFEGALLFLLGCRTGSLRIRLAAILLLFIGLFASLFDAQVDRYKVLFSYCSIGFSFLAVAIMQKNMLRAIKDSIKIPSFARLSSPYIHNILAIIGLCWWYMGFVSDSFKVTDFYSLDLLLIEITITSAVLFIVAKFSDFKLLARVASVAPILIAFLSLFTANQEIIALSPYSFLDDIYNDSIRPTLAVINFLSGLGSVAWILFFGITGAGLVLCRKLFREKLYQVLWTVFVVEIIVMLTCTGRALASSEGLSFAWAQFAGLIPSFIFLFAIAIISGKKEQPLKRIPQSILTSLTIAVPIVLFIPLAIWYFFQLFSYGNPAPLSFYIPILNPLEIEQLLCVTAFVMWQKSMKELGFKRFCFSLKNTVIVADIAVFLLLHSTLYRSIHYLLGYPFGAITSNEVFQVGLTVLWGIWGLVHIIIGSKIEVRRAWVVGAALIVLATINIFTVDFAGRGTLAKVISFLVMGGIFLLVGWLAPYPSYKKTDKNLADAENVQNTDIIGKSDGDNGTDNPKNENSSNR